MLKRVPFVRLAESHSVAVLIETHPQGIMPNSLGSWPAKLSNHQQFFIKAVQSMFYQHIIQRIRNVHCSGHPYFGDVFWNKDGPFSEINLSDL